MLCANKGGYFRGTAGHCNMTCRSMKSEQKFQRVRNRITRNLSHKENGSESSAESASESKRKNAKTRVKAVDQQRREEGLKGWSVKSKQSDAQREIELGERVSLFFINRPIKQGRPPSMFYFVRLLPYLFLSSCCVFSSLSPRSFFLAVVNPSARVSVPLSIRLVPFPSTNLLLLRCEEAHPLSVGSGTVLFLLFYSTFSREGGILLLPGRATPVFSGQ